MTVSHVTDLRGRLGAGALEIVRVLQAAGHDAVIVGGPVRDLVRGTVPHDVDIATAATPETVRRLFRRTFVVGQGERHGTIGVWSPDGATDHEVTTYRRDVETDGRHARVVFTSSLEEDLARRDFTINAMALRPDPSGGDHGVIVDPFGGQADLAERRLRTVGPAADRFREDYLRILRAYRFAGRLDLTIDPETRAGIRAAVAGLDQVSAERVRSEILKACADTAAPGALVRVLNAMHQDGVLGAVLPELAACHGVTQNRYHGHDVLQHILHATDAAGPGDARRRVALLLHDIGKPGTRTTDPETGEVHFYGHEGLGARMANDICERLMFSTADREWVVEAVAQHMRFHALPDVVSGAALRRIARDLKAGVTLEDLLAIRIADKAGSGLADRVIDAGRVQYLTERVEAVRLEAAALTTRDLALSGLDVMAALGIKPGPAVGVAMGRLLDAVVEDPALNTPEGLRDLLLRIGADLKPAPGLKR